MLVNQRVDYVFRPENLNDSCLYEYVSDFKKKKKENINDKYLFYQDNNNNKRRQTSAKRFLFSRTHPQINTHILIRRVTSVVPVLIEPQIHRKNNETMKDRYCRAILTLFIPWRNCAD